AFLIEHHDDPAIAEHIQAILETGTQPNMEPAPPEGLILWDVTYTLNVRWQSIDDCRNQFIKAMKKRYLAEQTRASIASSVFWATRTAGLEKKDDNEKK
nr:hypothetical protein [Candidatus Sigynarchaeota archaeon]